MEKRAAVLALALIIPIARYGIPYAYAATTSSTYIVRNYTSVASGGYSTVYAVCNGEDYATGGKDMWSTRSTCLFRPSRRMRRGKASINSKKAIPATTRPHRAVMDKVPRPG